MRLPLLLLLAAVVVVNAQSGGVRCFVGQYIMRLTPPSNFTALSDMGKVLYSTELDLLAAEPLMVSFDDIPLSQVYKNGCGRGVKKDMVHFVWSDDPRFFVPFASLPMECGGRQSQSFGLSTLGYQVWGIKARSVYDGSLFAVQGGRASMLTGMYNMNMKPRRTRPLMVHMSSERNFERALTVRSCIWADQVPYDMPQDVYEVDPPRLMPLAACTQEYGGRCATQLGYINSAGMPLELKYPSALNKLLPPSVENGFTMVTRFEEGVHQPSEFRPPLHVTWPCDYGEEPEQAHWLVDGLVLAFNSHDRLCNDPMNVDTMNIFENVQTAQERAMRKYHAKNIEMLKSLKPAKERISNGFTATMEEVEVHWAKQGLNAELARMSTRGLRITKAYEEAARLLHTIPLEELWAQVDAKNNMTHSNNITLASVASLGFGVPPSYSMMQKKKRWR